MVLLGTSYVLRVSPLPATYMATPNANPNAIMQSLSTSSKKRNFPFPEQRNVRCMRVIVLLFLCLCAPVTAIDFRTKEWMKLCQRRNSFTQTGRDWVPNRIKIFLFSLSIWCVWIVEHFNFLRYKSNSEWHWWHYIVFHMSVSGNIRRMNAAVILMAQRITHVSDFVSDKFEQIVFNGFHFDGEFIPFFQMDLFFYFFDGFLFWHWSMFIAHFRSRIDRHSTLNKKKKHFVKWWHHWVDVTSSRLSNTLHYILVTIYITLQCNKLFE